MRRWIFTILAVSVLLSGCGEGNVCQRQLEYEEEDCFPELEQPTDVDKDECTGDTKAYAKCAMSNKDAFCDYYLWQNRGAARREGYTVSDIPPTNGNDFVACLDEEGLRER